MRIVIKTKTAAGVSPLVVTPRQSVRIRHRQMRVLDFDVECRPLHFYGEYVSKEITAIAWAWVDEPDNVSAVLLGEVEPVDMLERFRAAYDAADIVTGHYIRGFDLPLVNGAMTEYQLPALSKKLSQDTKLDLVRRHGLSGSQENIGGMLGLRHPKEGMDQTKWRAANRLTPEGLEEVRRRVIGDVKQHIELRARLIALGYLGPACVWKPGGSAAPEYVP